MGRTRIENERILSFLLLLLVAGDYGVKGSWTLHTSWRPRAGPFRGVRRRPHLLPSI